MGIRSEFLGPHKPGGSLELSHRRGAGRGWEEERQACGVGTRARGSWSKGGWGLLTQGRGVGQPQRGRTGVGGEAQQGGDICICIADSGCCTAETNATL